MYTSLHIQGFRCFRDLKIEKLARINLIGGKNNTGKTALLEAVTWGAAGVYNPTCFLAFYDMRRLPPKETLQFFSFRDLFTWGTDELRSEFSAMSGEPSDTFTTALSASRVGEVEVAVDGPGAQDHVQHMPREEGLSGLLNLHVVRTGSDGGRLQASAEWRIGNLNFTMEQTEAPTGSHFETIRDLGTDQEHATRFGRLQVQKLNRPVVEALRSIQPDLLGVTTIMRGATPVFYADLGSPPLVPIGLLGEGMNRVLRIMTGVCSVPGGRFLVDEIENGLHYTVMPDVWGAIAKAAEELDVQVFATTHSDECIRAAYEAVPAEDLLYHRLDRVDGEIQCVTYEPDTLEAALDMPAEVR